MVKALHGAGIEVILDVVYNHTAEGNHLGPMLSLKGVDNLSYYRTVPGDARHYMDYTGTGNSLNPVHPSVLRLIMDSLRYFVDRGPRRRLPLRPRLGAGARVPRGRPALGLLRHHPPGSDPLRGEADRRAVGRRRGRLPGRQLPGALDGVERDLPRHDARLLARAGAGERVRLPLHRLERPLPARRPAAVRVDQLHHRARRLHPARPRHLQREAQRGEPGVEPGRRQPQPELEPRRRGRDRRRGDQRAPRAPAAQLPDDAAPLAGRADAARRRRDRPHAARQQQRLLPGQRDLLDQLAARRAQAAPARVDEAADRPAHAPPGLPARRLPHRRGAARLGRARRLVVPGRRPQDDAAELAGRQRAHARRLPQRLRDPDPDRARRAGDRRHLPDPLQRLGGRRRLHAAGGLVRAPLGARALDRRTLRPRRARRRTGRGQSSPVEGRSLVLLRRVG